MSNTQQRRKGIRNISVILFISAILGVIALLSYYNPLQFALNGEKIELGNYDYRRVQGLENPDTFEIIIEPSRFGYIRARRAAKAAASDLALRLGYNNAAILTLKKRNSPNSPAVIRAQVFLFDAHKRQSPPKGKSVIHARQALEKEPYPIFLEELNHLWQG